MREDSGMVKMFSCDREEEKEIIKVGENVSVK